MRTPKVWITLLLVAGLPLFGGCSKPANTAARWSGKLTYKGKPVGGGSMRVYPAGGASVDVPISTDGTFQATDLPVGEHVITVETESVNPAKTGKGKSAEDKKRASTGVQKPPQGRAVPTENAEALYVKIPEKYNNQKTSPLTITLASGRQVKDIELTD